MPPSKTYNRKNKASDHSNFQLVVRKATGLMDTEVLGKMDTYCKVVVGEQDKRTKTARDGGTEPKWSRDGGTLDFTACPAEVRDLQAHILLFDKERVGTDDFVGEAKVNIGVVAWNCAKDDKLEWEGGIPVFAKGLRSGTIFIEVKFEDARGIKEQFPTGSPRFGIAVSTPAMVTSNPGWGRLQGKKDDDGKTNHTTFQVHLLDVEKEFVTESGKPILHYGLNGQHPTTFDGSVMGGATRIALSAAHGSLYGGSSARSWFFSTDRSKSLMDLIGHGSRNNRLRVFTYALTDKGWCFSETGHCTARDNLTKHAIHANAAMAVNYAGTFRICFEKDTRRPFLVIDNDSGTYQPKHSNSWALRKVLAANFPCLQVIVLDAVDPTTQEAWMKELIGPIEVSGQEGMVYPGKWQWAQAPGWVEANIK